MSFRVGQKVACVNANFPADYAVPFKNGWMQILPSQDCVYTIRGIVEFPFRNEVATGLLLEEIKNKEVNFSHGLCEHPFSADRFRPLVERKTDTGMAILRKVADDAAKRKNLVVTG